MKLERATWNVALIWASFRMIANMIGKAIFGLLDLVAYLLQLALQTMIVGAVAAGLWWIWKVTGLQLPF